MFFVEVVIVIIPYVSKEVGEMRSCMNKSCGLSHDLVVIVLCIVGILHFRKTEKTFADVI